MTMRDGGSRQVAAKEGTWLDRVGGVERVWQDAGPLTCQVTGPRPARVLPGTRGPSRHSRIVVGDRGGSLRLTRNGFLSKGRSKEEVFPIHKILPLLWEKK